MINSYSKCLFSLSLKKKTKPDGVGKNIITIDRILGTDYNYSSA